MDPVRCSRCKRFFRPKDDGYVMLDESFTHRSLEDCIEALADSMIDVENEFEQQGINIH